jgi:3-oxoacyl-[acyl-carrier protein] reductase
MAEQSQIFCKRMYLCVYTAVNNAGVLLYKNFVDMYEEKWEKTININLTGTFLFCKTVLLYMVKSYSGVIINVSSGGGKMGFTKLSAYCASLG